MTDLYFEQVLKGQKKVKVVLRLASLIWACATVKGIILRQFSLGQGIELMTVLVENRIYIYQESGQ